MLQTPVKKRRQPGSGNSPSRSPIFPSKPPTATVIVSIGIKVNYCTVLVYLFLLIAFICA